MEIVMATATEVKNNFGKYLDMVMNGQQIMITKNGKEVARMVPKDEVVKSLTSQLLGILPDTIALEDEKEELTKALKEKHGITD